MADTAAPKAFDASAVKDDGFYDVRLSRSVVLNGDPLPAANAVRLSGASVKQIADAIYTATEVAEDAPHDIMRKNGEGPISTS